MLPCYLAAFGTSNVEVPNTASSTGSVRDLTGAIPDLPGAIPDLPGSIRDLKFVKSARSGTLPVDLAVLGTSLALFWTSLAALGTSLALFRTSLAALGTSNS